LLQNGGVHGAAEIPASIRMTHHHHPGHGHPAAVVVPSLLRMPLAQRLTIAGCTIVAIWSLVWWAHG